MGLCAGRWSYSASGLALGAALLFSTGCQTPMEKTLFVATGPGWRVQEGQALWRPKREFPELGGELMVATQADGCCEIQFTKTPFPLVLAQTTRTNWLFQFPPRRMSFAGRHAPPGSFAWLYLHSALAGEPLPRQFHFHTKPDGGWRLENVRSGETLEGFLAP